MLETIVNLVRDSNNEGKAETSQSKEGLSVEEQLTHIFHSQKTLSKKCRRGLDPSVRRAVWLRLVFGEAYEEKKREGIDMYEDSIRELFKSDPCPGDTIPTDLIPDFGSPVRWDKAEKLKISNQGTELNLSVQKPLTTEELPPNLTPKDYLAMKTILCVIASNNPDINFSPLLVSMVPLLLQESIPESTVYAMIQQMIDRSKKDQWFFTTNANSFSRMVLTFSMLCQAKVPKLYAHMMKLGVFPARLFQTWFARMYVGYCIPSVSRHLLDVYFNEGCTVLVNFGLAILKLYQDVLLRSTHKSQFLSNLSLLMLLDDAEGVLDCAYDLNLSRTQILKLNQSHRPLRHMPRARIETFHFPVFDPRQSELMTLRDCVQLWSWLPKTLYIYDPVLLFSVEKDGYSLRTMLTKCAERPHILLVKDSTKCVFGAFVNQWKNSSVDDLYADGQSFIFTLKGYPALKKGESDEKDAKDESPSKPKLKELKPVIFRTRTATEKSSAASALSISASTVASAAIAVVSGAAVEEHSASPMKREAKAELTLSPLTTATVPTKEGFTDSSGLRQFLEDVKMLTLIDGQDTKMVAENSTVQEVATTLATYKILSMPVVSDLKGKHYLCTIDVHDVIHAMLTRIPEEILSLKFKSDTKTRLVEIGNHASHVKIDVRHHADTFEALSETQTLCNLVYWFASGNNRAPIVDKQHSVVGVVSKSHVIQFLESSADNSNLTSAFGVKLVALGHQAPDTVKYNDSVLAAAIKIDTLALGGVGVVNDEGVLVGNLSASDISNLLSKPEKWVWLTETVMNYLKQFHPSSLNIISVPKSASLRDALTLMREKKIHRVWIVDEVSKPVGLVTQTDAIDVLRWMLEGPSMETLTRARRLSFVPPAVGEEKATEAKDKAATDSKDKDSKDKDSKDKDKEKKEKKEAEKEKEPEKPKEKRRSFFSRSPKTPKPEPTTAPATLAAPGPAPAPAPPPATTTTTTTTTTETELSVTGLMMTCDPSKMVALGDSEAPAFALDARLAFGYSRPTNIFGNTPVSYGAFLSGKEGQFSILSVECWGFQ